jgi:hypothetical protein
MQLRVPDTPTETVRLVRVGDCPEAVAETKATTLCPQLRRYPLVTDADERRCERPLRQIHLIGGPTEHAAEKLAKRIPMVYLSDSV